MKKEHPRAKLPPGWGADEIASSFLNVFFSKLNKNMDNTLDLSVSNPIISVYR